METTEGCGLVKSGSFDGAAPPRACLRNSVCALDRISIVRYHLHGRGDVDVFAVHIAGAPPRTRRGGPTQRMAPAPSNIHCLSATEVDLPATLRKRDMPAPLKGHPPRSGDAVAQQVPRVVAAQPPQPPTPSRSRHGWCHSGEAARESVPSRLDSVTRRRRHRGIPDAVGTSPAINCRMSLRPSRRSHQRPAEVVPGGGTTTRTSGRPGPRRRSPAWAP